jgi:hypothetical protein
MKKVVDGPPGWVCEPCNRVWDKQLKRCSVCGRTQNYKAHSLTIRAAILASLTAWEKWTEEKFWLEELQEQLNKNNRTMNEAIENLAVEIGEADDDTR